MQQYRVLNKKSSEFIDPRKRFIEDLIDDIQREKAMNGKVLIAGDFNEDPADSLTDGINKLTEACALKNRFQEIKGYTPSTRNNRRSIDRFLTFRKAPEQDRIDIFNLIHDKWPTGMVQAKWDGEKDPLCQRCSDREETFQHIFSYTSKNASDTFSKGLVTFRTALRKANTAPIVISAFETMFLSFRKEYPTTPKKHHYQSNEMNDLVHATLAHQRKIGEKFFVQGFTSSNWEIPQNPYLGKQDFNDSTTDWSTKVIRAIWKFSCSLWKARCDYIHGNKTGRSACACKKELVSLIQTELKRTEQHAEHTTR